MLKLLIVDDEELVRQLIELCVDWEELGFRVVGMADTAEDGISKVEELKPDVVFTDVRMPGQTGLDLARTVLERYPQIKVVVISGYDEFSYVNEGLKIGIFDYLLKPISEEALSKVAIKVRDAIFRERSHNAEFECYKREYERNYQAIREKAISRLVYSQNADLISDSLKVFGIELQKDCYQAAILEYGLGEDFETEEELIESFHVREALEVFLKQHKQIYFFERSYPFIVMLNNEMSEGFEDFCSRIGGFLVDHGIFVRIGIGGFYRDVRQLHISYREAKMALKNGFSRHSGECISISEINKGMVHKENIQKNMIHNYTYYIEQGMFKEAKQQIHELFDDMRGQALSRDQAAIQTIIILDETFRAACNMQIQDELTKEKRSRFEIIMQASDLTEMEECLQKLVDKVIELVNIEAEKQPKGIVDMVEDYIKTQYSDPDISLARAAELVYTNPNYLSRAFHKSTGKTFRKFLSDLRMEKALQLLQTTPLKAYEVAERVGIRDPNYFSVCFKKKYGCSVQDIVQRKI